MSRSSLRAWVPGGIAVIVVLTLATGAAAQSASNGMLREQDVGIDQAKAAHNATLLRASQQAPGSCEEPQTREYEGRQVSFGDASGPSLTEYVLDLGSADEARATFGDFKADEQATISCGDTQFRSGTSLKKTPKGVGSRRYTFVSRPTIGGKRVTVTSICAVGTQYLVLLVFVAWPDDAAKPAAVAKKAVNLLV